jgi:type II secretory pathway component PulJ
MRLARNEAGFTLVEMLVTMLLMMIALFALYSIFDMSLRVFSFGNDKTEAVENARLGLAKMERELRAAYPYTKMDGNSTNDYLFASFGTDPGSPVSPNPAASVTFANERDGDRQVDTDTATEQITYSLSGGSPATLLRNGEPLVEFVQPGGLRFTFCQSAESCPPPTSISEGQVRMVRIELRVRVDRGIQAGAQTLTTDVALRNRVG